MATARRWSNRTRLMAALVTAVVAVLGWSQVASAHTAFESSVPSDGAVVDGPLTEVVLNFTNPAQPAGDGFELLDPIGTVRTPTSVDETDGTSFVLSFDPPLGAGVHGLRWSVRAGDAHPIEGSFRFEVVAAASEATSATTAPTATTTVAAGGSSQPAVTVPVTEASATPPSDAAEGAASSSLDEFLSTGSADAGSVPAGRAGRTLSMIGTIFGVGVLAALVWTVRGDSDELLAQVAWVRLAGLVVVAGGVIEFAALDGAEPSRSVAELLSTRPGLATALKVAGGVAVLVGFHRGAGRISAPALSLSAAVATDLTTASPPTVADEQARSDAQRWVPTSTAALGLVGYALILSSFWFDGHTVSRGPWLVHSLVNLVHVGAGAVWAGGVFAMTTIAWMRRRRGGRLGLADMVVRFSSVATVSLVAVLVAGSLMAWMILDSPGDLFDTDWGRTLVAKTVVVGVAAALGAFNHFRLRPALQQRPDDRRLAQELRIALSIESVVFVAVVVLTAFLAAAAT